MSEHTLSALQNALKTLSNSDLVELEVREGGAALRLTFAFAGFVGGEEVEWVVCLYGVEKLAYQRTLSTNESAVILEALVQGQGDRYQFLLDGEVVLEAICADVKILKPLAELVAISPEKVAMGQ